MGDPYALFFEEDMDEKETLATLASIFCKDFDALFEFDENSDFVVTKERLTTIQKWFNDNKQKMCFFIEIDVLDIHFNHNFDTDKGKAENNRIMLYAYSMAYVTKKKLEKYLITVC